MKTCSKCQQAQPFDQYGRAKATSDGLQTWCKDCQRAYATERRKRLTSRLVVNTPESKFCSGCQKTKAASEYHINRSVLSGLQARCIDCARIDQREYLVQHADVVQMRRLEKLGRTPNPDTVKRCNRCLEAKPLLSFYAHRGTKDGRATYCMECQKASTRAWNKANAEKIRIRNADYRADPRNAKRIRMNAQGSWLRLYGLTEEAYSKLLADQGGVCAICGQVETYVDSRTGFTRRLAVDHDHATYKIRGLLCGACNQGLGHFGDSATRCQRAVDYLRDSADAANPQP